jgi:hypothetical protein
MILKVGSGSRCLSGMILRVVSGSKYGFGIKYSGSRYGFGIKYSGSTTLAASSDKVLLRKNKLYLEAAY